MYTNEPVSNPKQYDLSQADAEASDGETTETNNDSVPPHTSQTGCQIHGVFDSGEVTSFTENDSGRTTAIPGLPRTTEELDGTDQTTGQAFVNNASLASSSPFANFHADNSPLAFASGVSPGSAPFQWYDLLAQDSVTYFENHSLLNQDITWDFDPRSLSRRPSASKNVERATLADVDHSELSGGLGQRPSLSKSRLRSEVQGKPFVEPWNLTEPIILLPAELRYFQHYVKEVAPILDMFDPLKHFGNIVPHMALRNVGLLKALLGVAARHMSLQALENVDAIHAESPSPEPMQGDRENHGYAAVQYFYETLKSLAAAMQIPSYTRSSEILATAVMISTYEMFDGSSQEWERHLRGAFWIQRNQDNDGESRGLQEAVWWAWVRQDIWAAFRAGRRTLTIWRPKKPLEILTADELSTRVVYLLAKSVSYASKEAMRTQDLNKRLEDGDALLQALDDWFAALPQAYRPIPFSRDEDAVFKPIWIHPPAYAAAVQSFHFAKIIILLNKPSAGGVSSYHKRVSTIRDSSRAICGLSLAPTNSDPASAFVNFQCLFAAGQSFQGHEEQKALVAILDKAINASQFAPKTLIDDLRKIWKEQSPVAG
ncbi:hypothetical protein H2200_003319 [Cladophialophora chaetospira]|uniref:Transcription factor domain-containing protein n=1 Tax=Cladophialophora chaetospira TaxID=386627 RepID=A0AA38XH95_9EURO|nr:hypothetical protein H2200_003319 [Cladophialophora chaetospira]